MALLTSQVLPTYRNSRESHCPIVFLRCNEKVIKHPETRNRTMCEKELNEVSNFNNDRDSMNIETA